MNIWDKFSLKDKVSIITGGARGLGKAMALSLAQAGSNIVIADVDLAAAESTAADLAQEGVRALGVKVDVTSADEVQKMVDAVTNEFGTIDVLFNNAGIAQWVPLEEMRFEDWSRIMKVNLDSMFLVSQAVGKVMIAQKKGSIINTASMSGLIVNTPQPQTAYNVSKAGVIMFTKSLAVEWAPHNVRVNAIAPGYMETEMTGQFRQEHAQKVDFWMDLTPMHRMGQPHELGGLAVFLASEASSFSTGGVYVADGGYSLT